MTKRMLIDASHPEETRVVVISGNRLEEFDFESSTKRQLKGNIYLAKVVRVEPSLQAAFVDYGGNRHGFLAFGEIHPDYYKIPIADRQALLDEDAEPAKDGDETDDESVEVVGGDEVEEIADQRRRVPRHYKIQEVIKRRQIVLVQVVKEERGTKGAALTTYLSLAGRYCVLMPNTARGGGVSRKITNPKDRKRLKTIVGDLKITGDIAVIVRTAGSQRTKAEVKRDYDYLIRLWDEVRERTLSSSAPALIYEEANIIKRAIRDLYTKEIEEIVIDGEESYKTAKEFMKIMIPSHAKKVQPYSDHSVPMFRSHQVESQIDAIHNPTVRLKSGGYIVLSPTEALVSIDVNSGRATRERHIEETALNTNVEAADEIARQLRLRDLAGLVVIDFIDMEEKKNLGTVERRLKDAMRDDRARSRLGRISPFGLLELSRQRLRPSLVEASTQTCPACAGSGYIRSTESTSLHILRAIEEEGIRKRAVGLTVTVPTAIAFYLLNQKRDRLREIETRCDFQVFVLSDDQLVAPDFRIERTGAAAADDTVVARADDDEAAQGPRKPQRRRRSKREEPAETIEAAVVAEPAQAKSPEESQASEGRPPKRRRRRGKRGGRRRGLRDEATATETIETMPSPAVPDGGDADAANEAVDAAPAPETAASPPDRAGGNGESKPAGRRTRRKPKPQSISEVAPAAADASEDKPPRRSRREKSKAAPRVKREDGGNGAGPDLPRSVPEVPDLAPAFEAEPIAVPVSGSAAPEEGVAPEVPLGARRRGWWRRLSE